MYRNEFNPNGVAALCGVYQPHLLLITPVPTGTPDWESRSGWLSGMLVGEFRHDMHMLHHLSFAVADLARSAAFYDAVLSTLGYVRFWADETAVGYVFHVV